MENQKGMFSFLYTMRDKVGEIFVDWLVYMVSGTSTVLTFTKTQLLSVPPTANETGELAIKILDSVIRLIGVISPFLWILFKRWLKKKDKKDDK
jgi:hypothetical protein